MSEMLIQPATKEHLVTDYDFVFSTGLVMPVTIDLEAGDTYVDHGSTISIVMRGKPSLTDPDTMTPDEKVTVFKQHLLAVQERTRLVDELTPDERFDLAEFYSKMSETLQ